MAETYVRLRADQVEPLDRYAHADGRSRSGAAQFLIDQALRQRRESEQLEEDDGR
jgi:hypothetical protein